MLYKLITNKACVNKQYLLCVIIIDSSELIIVMTKFYKITFY